MKYLLLFILVSFILGCSGSDDSNPVNQDDNAINPPTWIQGNWVLENNTGYGFRFTSDDLCLKSIGIFTCNKEALEMYEGTNVFTNVDEHMTNTEYSVEIMMGSSTTAYQFQKISNTQIECITPIQAIYTKQ